MYSDRLFLFPSTRGELKTAVAALCQMWWSQGWPGKERLAPNMATFLLVTALLPAAQPADVARLYDARAALLELDYADASAATLTTLFQQCMSHPALLASPEV